MNDAPVTEAEIQAHVDGRLPSGRAAAVEAWLAKYPDEASRVASYRAQRDALRAALDPVLDEPLPLALDLRLREGAPTGRPGFGRSALAASIAGLLLAGGGAGWTLRGLDAQATTGTAALAREAAASYAIYADDRTRPVEIGADQRRTLDAWLSRRLSRPIAAPDLDAAGLRLIGGRLLPTEHGPAALYLYQNAAGERTALYLRIMKSDDATDRMTRRDEDGLRGWTWADDGLGFGVFGAASDDFLHSAADMVRARYRQS
ncbi:MAG TPA: anti-sigma factor [Sphingomonas sp.]|nr:anti-sigma factor [Sphingomonas sp.]